MRSMVEWCVGADAGGELDIVSPECAQHQTQNLVLSLLIGVSHAL